jgi:hypothetical protein
MEIDSMNQTEYNAIMNDICRRVELEDEWRKKVAGKICCRCSTPLPGPYTFRSRQCERCAPPGTRPIKMCFELKVGWHCRFLEKDQKTTLGKCFIFRDSASMRTLAERGLGFVTGNTRRAFEHAIKRGRGGIWLQLTAEQYRILFATQMTGTTSNRECGDGNT